MRRVWILLALLLLAGSAHAEDKAKAREAWVGDLLVQIYHSDGDGTWTNVTPSPLAGGEKWQISGTSDHDVYCFSEDGLIFHYY